MADPPKSTVYLFDGVAFEPAERRLVRAGSTIHLQPKTCETLLYLVERAGRLIEKNELLDALWEGVHVTENALARSIKEIRRALGDDARKPRIIETVPRVGYRFVATVEREVEREPADRAGAAHPSSASLKPRRFAGLVVAMLAVATLLGILWWRSARSGEEEAGPGMRVQADRMMLVVLPFENLGAPEDAYFAAGMTDELTSRLAEVSDLGVISRLTARRYAGSPPSLPQLHQDLDVDYVIEGSVRWAKTADGASRVRITPKLVRVADQTQLWSGTFDRDLEDVFSIQADIAARVIDELGTALPEGERSPSALRPTMNMDAYQAWLKGMDRWYVAGFDLERFGLAAELFERAAELDPGFLQPLVNLVQVHGVAFTVTRAPERLEKMKRALDRAQALAPDAPEVDLARCAWLNYAAQSFDEAFARCQAASASLPSRPEPVEMMAFIRRRQGRSAEAVELLERVLELSPRDAHTHYELATTLEGLRRFEEADVHYLSTCRLEPENPRLFAERAMLYIRWRGDLDEAVAIASNAIGSDAPATGADSPVETLDPIRRNWEAMRQRFEQRSPRPTDPSPIPYDLFARAYEELGQAEMADSIRRRLLESSRERAAARPNDLDAQMTLASAEAVNGNRERALDAIDRMQETIGPNRFLSPLADELRAFVFTQVGEPEAALDLIEDLLRRSYMRPLTVPLLRLAPDWDPLRAHPRFELLVAPAS